MSVAEIQRRATELGIIGGKETRSAGRPLKAVHARATQPTGNVVSGYGAVYNVETVIGGLFRERIAPTAFDKVLRSGQRTFSFFNHNPNNVLASTQANTLRLQSDRTGLIYRAQLDLSNPTSKSVFKMIQRGDVSDASFMFRIGKETWSEGRMPLRTIDVISDLYEIGPVTIGAYPQASSGTAKRTAYEKWFTRFLELEGRAPTFDEVQEWHGS